MKAWESTAPRTRRRLVLTILSAACCVAVALGACTAAHEAGPFFEAATRAASNTGRSVEEVTQAIRTAMKGATESDLAAAAEKEAARTDWIAALASKAQRENAAKTARAVQGATCEVVNDAKPLLTLPMDDAIKAIVMDHLSAEGLNEGEVKVKDIVQSINLHLVPYVQTGKVNDPQGALIDLGCLFPVP
jgi:hypothetical protein